jgi:hypothetical protein
MFAEELSRKFAGITVASYQADMVALQQSCKLVRYRLGRKWRANCLLIEVNRSLLWRCGNFRFSRP